MFLKYLSDHDVEERYWPFIFRFETLAAGVVWEASGKIGSMTDEQAREFFSSVYAGALDENSGLTPPGWWSKVEPPPYGWFCEYIERELPFMIKEARRLVEERKNATQTDEERKNTDSFDRVKVRRCAHSSPVFRSFLGQS